MGNSFVGKRIDFASQDRRVQSAASSHALGRCGKKSVLNLRASVEWEGNSDLNQLQTALNAAIKDEDYSQAAKIRDRIAQVSGSGEERPLSWLDMGVPDWLADRADRMGFSIPTQVQRNSMRTAQQGKDTIIRSQTGSGKTLAYLIPILSLLSNDLLDEDISLYLSKFTNKDTNKGQKISKTLDTEVLATPAAVIVVPTRELGIQVAMLAYQLLGGQRNNPAILPERIPTKFEPGSKLNMFSYQGPRRVKVAGVWDDNGLNASMPIEDFGLDILKGVHIVVGTPTYLEALAKRGHIAFENARFVVVDEADECLAEGSAMQALFAACDKHRDADWHPPSKKSKKFSAERVRFFAGASLEFDAIKEAVDRNWLDKPVMVGASFDNFGIQEWETQQRVPSSLEHKYVVVDEWQALGTMSRLIRQEIMTAMADNKDPPRMIIYAKDATAAVNIASPLQNALWTGLGGDIDQGLWGLSVLLPSAEDMIETNDDNVTALTYQSSIRVMEMFLFNQVNVLVTTPRATRGLDFPGVTHVFNLGIVGTPADYLHRAGRVGRIGQQDMGKVISVLQEEEAERLGQLGEQLAFAPEAMPVPAQDQITDQSDTDDKVRFLEDVFQLFNTKSGKEDGI